MTSEKDRIANRQENIEYAKSRGDEIQANVLANSRRTEIATLDISRVPWSQAPLYGYNHSQQVSMVAYELGLLAGLTPQDLEAVKVAGLLHDVGRSRPWQNADPGHQQLSAEIAVRLLRGATETHGNARLRDRVEQLILGLDLGAKELPTDPALQVLWDIDSLESARYAPGTVEGHKIFSQRASRLCTPFARDRFRQEQMLKHHGWQL